MFRAAFKLEQTFLTRPKEDGGPLPQPGKVATEVKDLLTEFKKNVPLIQALCTKGMGPRHWEKVSALTKPICGTGKE